MHGIVVGFRADARYGRGPNPLLGQWSVGLSFEDRMRHRTCGVKRRLSGGCEGEQQNKDDYAPHRTSKNADYTRARTGKGAADGARAFNARRPS